MDRQIEVYLEVLVDADVAEVIVALGEMAL